MQQDQLIITRKNQKGKDVQQAVDVNTIGSDAESLKQKDSIKQIKSARTK